MDMSFMMVFDIIVGVLGLYLVFIGIKGYKTGEVDPMIVTTEELTRCNDKAGLSKYLMPKTAIFGGFCIIFGIQGLLNDTGKIPFSQAINVAFLIAFLAVWIIFSYFIRKAKQLFIH